MAARVTLILLTVTYFLIFIGSACVSISGTIQIIWNGRCILFASGEWTGPLFIFTSETYAHTPCNFVSIACALISFHALIMFIYCMYTLRAKSRQGKDITNLAPTVFSTSSTTLMLACAIVISAGLAVFCEDITSKGNVYPTCRDAQTHIKWIGRDGSNFYDITNFAQCASWALFVCSLTLSGVLFFRLHQEHNSRRSSYIIQRPAKDREWYKPQAS
ncbi:transmembrane protein 179-like isoform X1 [Lingula anatina]|uniref:Transmembrane protein 179-like isoform X1 n=1 Tax=Lingula anatina TaxID=7574 RepID=A0A1S3HR28_LINAN|nr:transmembrane protein 179-like isoform X1 [Lingula anatina]|eukprot:XP_013388497.1 transmembrane protein 179-like isoform X1 [Lingula anatina]